MPGTGWSSVDLLERFNRLTGRNSSADTISPSVKYGYLADAEQEIITRIALNAPNVLYGAPTALTTADGGYTFTFGTDGNGYALFPMGRATIYPSLSAIPGGAWVPGRDYLDEGTTIRMPWNTPYTGTLYWYGITPTQQLSASVQPVLQPPEIRMLIVRLAAANFAETAMRNVALSDRQLARYEVEFGRAITMLRKHFSNGGVLGQMLYPWGVGAYGPGWSGTWWT